MKTQCLLHAGVVFVLLSTCTTCIFTAETSHAYREISEQQKTHDTSDLQLSGDRECVEDHGALHHTGLCSEKVSRADDHDGGGIGTDDDTNSNSNTNSCRSVKWDPNGYIMFCANMGNFGNQIEQYLGTIAFAKALNRTLILPPFAMSVYKPNYRHLVFQFTEMFQVDPLLEYHRVIPFKEFLEVLAPTYWPPGQRTGYHYMLHSRECNFSYDRYWGNFAPPIEFDECLSFRLFTNADTSDEDSMVAANRAWNEEFPLKEHPVLAFKGAKGVFPMLPGNRHLQKYLRWADEIFTEAKTYITETFGDETWVSVHLRNGEDWVKSCDRDLSTQSFFMASTQCHHKKVGAVTQDMCLPSLSHMMELVLKVFTDVKAKHLFIATDKHPYIEDFQRLLQPLGASVHFLNPSLPRLDLMVLGQGDYFIGNCVSSFTSFVKRERDASDKPSIFWGLEYNGFQ